MVRHEVAKCGQVKITKRHSQEGNTEIPIILIFSPILFIFTLSQTAATTNKPSEEVL